MPCIGQGPEHQRGIISTPSTLQLFCLGFCRLNCSYPWRRFADTTQSALAIHRLKARLCRCTSRPRDSHERKTASSFTRDDVLTR
jgi:hypothetical protein